MKRKLLAIAIPALLVAAGANASIEVWNKDGNKLNFNGRVKVMNHITDRGQAGEGDKSEARFGFTGQTQVTEGLSGYGKAEWETKVSGNNKDGNDSAGLKNRYAFAGLNFGQYGSFDYGRNDGVLKAITAYTDVLPEFGGNAANNNLYALSARTKAVATYRNNSFFGLNDDISFALQYADNGDATTADKEARTVDGKNGGSKEAFGAIAQWKIFDTGLTFGAGYSQTAGSSKDGASTAENVKTWSTGIKYDNYNLYLAAIYSQSKFNDSNVFNQASAGRGDQKVKGVELVAQYGIDLEVGRLTPSLAYVQHKANGDDVQSDNYLTKYVSVGALYNFNKNLVGLVEYQFNLLDEDDIGAANNLSSKKYRSNGDLITKPGTKDVLGVGLIYQF